MKFELHIKIDSGNQAVVDNPKGVMTDALVLASDRIEKFDTRCDNDIHAVVRDTNGNRIGTAMISFETGEDE
jgi:hypothetical protein